MKKSPNRKRIDKAAEYLASYAMKRAPFRLVKRRSMERRIQKMLVDALVARSKNIRDFLATWTIILQRQIDEVAQEHHSKVIQRWNDCQSKGAGNDHPRPEGRELQVADDDGDVS
ncbi:MAG TPA: hypothetical protein VHQ47_17870 [Phycisphaerae bacterium]|jgi:hypothetical protein|nr:hypothetical protein [Phycisphaerae bacterium]